jgi:hypothetical protein
MRHAKLVDASQKPTAAVKCDERKGSLALRIRDADAAYGVRAIRARITAARGASEG